MAVSHVPSLPSLEENTPATGSYCCCHTDMELFKFKYMWTISNFSLLPQETGKCLKTSFSMESSDQSKWSVEMYPRGTDNDSKNDVSLFLRLASSNKNKMAAKFEFNMLNTKKEKINKGENSSMHTFQPGSDWGFKKFVSRELLVGTRSTLSDDKVTICCELVIMGDVVNSYDQGINFKVPKRLLSEDYNLLFENGNFSDVILSVRGGEFQVHKAILAARSPVFQAMFEHEMRESKHNSVNITDVDYEVLREMLKYIYTGKTTRLEEMAYDLLAAADKYALEELRVMCEEVLCKNLTIDNASKILMLADLHSADQLKIRTINFINRYALEVMDTAGWQNMIQTNPQLIAEVYRASKTPTKE